MSPDHHTSIEHEPPSVRHGGALVLRGGHRGRCTCGWWSDCYAQWSDAERAIEVHLRRARRLDFDALIEKSSIGAGIADIKKRGIDAHLIDLEREMRGWRGRTRKAKRPGRLKPEDAATKLQDDAKKPEDGAKKLDDAAKKLDDAAKKLQDAAFMRGFGVALAEIWRCQHDGQLVKMLLKENGFTITSFRDVGLMDADFEAIRQAIE